MLKFTFEILMKEGSILGVLAIFINEFMIEKFVWFIIGLFIITSAFILS